MRKFLLGKGEGEGEGRGKTSKTFVRKVLQGYKLSASRVEKGEGITVLPLARSALF